MRGRTAAVGACLVAAALCLWLLRDDAPPAPGASDGAPRDAVLAVPAEGVVLDGAPSSGPPAAERAAAPPADPAGTSSGPADRLVIAIRLDGKPGLPANMVVRLDGAVVDDAELGADAARGERVWLLPPDGSLPRTVAVSARGYLDVEPQAVAPDALRVTFDLRSGGRLVVLGAPPPDDVAAVRLQRRDDGRWTFLDPRAWNRTSFPEAHPEFFGLPAGRYRAVDVVTDAASAEAEVVPGSTASVTLDLSDSTTFAGRVEGPLHEDLRPAVAYVVREGSTPPAVESVHGMETRARWPAFGRVEADGRFVLRARRGERVRVAVAHRWLRPASGPGGVEAVVGLTEPVLRLVHGPEVRFSVESGVRVATSSGAVLQHLAVTLRPAAASAPASGASWSGGGTVRIGVPAPGRWTMTVDDGGSAPYETTVEVPDGPVDLGAIALSPGSTLRVRVDAPPGRRDRLLVRVETGAFTRHGHFWPPPDGPGTVRGLPAGEHRLLVDEVVGERAADRGPSRRTVAERAFRADGVNDVELDLDLTAARSP